MQVAHQATDIVDKIVAEKRRLYLAYSEAAAPFRDIRKLLEELKARNVPLAVVTGTVREAAVVTIKRLFPDSFRAIVSGSDVRSGKPNPEPYLTAIEQLRIGNRDQCLVVENAPLGVESAIAAGIPVFGMLMNSPLQPRDLTEVGASRVFFNALELQEAISSLRFGQLQKRPSE